MKLKQKRIMMAGPSGIGKTTLAKWLSEATGIEFLSGSMSDLLPYTKDVDHQRLLSDDNKKQLLQDYQLVNLRHKLFGNSEAYITDRSYLDSAAYFIYKQSRFEANCTISDFIYTCKQLTLTDCDVLILLSLDDPINWTIENNNKRITNNYFQIQISKLCEVALNSMGYYESNDTPYIKGRLPFLMDRLSRSYQVGYINSSVYMKSIKVVTIPNLNLDERKKILAEVLC